MNHRIIRHVLTGFVILGAAACGDGMAGNETAVLAAVDSIRDGLATGNELKVADFVQIESMSESLARELTRMAGEETESPSELDAVFDALLRPDAQEALRVEVRGAYDEVASRGIQATIFDTTFHRSHTLLRGVLEAVTMFRPGTPIVEQIRDSSAILAIPMTAIEESDSATVRFRMRLDGGRWQLSQVSEWDEAWESIEPVYARKIRAEQRRRDEVARAAREREAEAARNRAAEAEPIMPDWYQMDGNNVTLDISAGLTDAGNYWNYNGFQNGELTITVPEGANVTIDFFNYDPQMPHSIGVHRAFHSPPAFPAPTPVFDGAISANPTSMTQSTMPGGDSDTITFTASRAGEYTLVCHIPAHAISGHWVRFVVSPDRSRAGVHFGT